MNYIVAKCDHESASTFLKQCYSVSLYQLAEFYSINYENLSY